MQMDALPSVRRIKKEWRLGKDFDRAIQSGACPSYRIGSRTRRVIPAEVLEWVRSHRVEPRPQAVEAARALRSRRG